MGDSVRPKNLKKCTKLNWNFQRGGGGVLEKIPSVGRYGHFLELHNPSYSSRVCAKCALKTWNTIELARFLKANLNPIVADVEATFDDCETQQRWKRKSKSSMSGEKPKSTKTPTANQRVKCLY